MPEQAQVEHIPLTKRRLLEFLEGQEELVTAKVVSIDLDSRASTVTEMLERCAAQGLVEREANQRPREYRISEAGRRRLKLFRSDQANSEPQSDEPPETNADASGSESDREQIGSLDFTELRGEVTRQFEGLREDMHDLFDALSLRPSPAEGLRVRAEQVKRRLESFAERVKADA